MNRILTFKVEYELEPIFTKEELLNIEKTYLENNFLVTLLRIVLKKNTTLK